MSDHLTIKDLSEVYTCLYGQKGNWLSIGRALGVSDEALHSIGDDLRCDTSLCLRGMLAERLKMSQPLTWSELQHKVDNITIPVAALQKYPNLYDDAMKSGYVTVRTTNVLLFGMAGTGKTSTRHLVLGLPPPNVRTSTPLAKEADCAHREIRDLTGMKVQVEESEWKLVTANNFKKLVVDIIQSYSRSSAEVSEGLATKLESLSLPRQTSSATFSVDSGMSLDFDPMETDSEEEKGKFLKHVSDVVSEIQLMVKQKPQIQEVFGSNWIYFIDSGGQPHFHNLLPIFVQDVSIALYVLRLSDRLDDYPLVEYYKDGKPASEPFRSNLTTVDNFKLLIQSIQSRNEDCRIVCIGTHLDRVKECSETIPEKNHRLFSILPREVIENCHYKNIHNKDLLFTYNIQDQNNRRESSIELQTIIDSCPPKYIRQLRVPVWWYVFELIVNKITAEEHTKVLSLKQCKSIADELCLQGETLNEALAFFHKHHIFHYYPDILPDVVFCSTQVLLDKLSELIEHAAFLRDDTKSTSHVDGRWIPFRERGIVTADLLEEFQNHYVTDLFGPDQLLEIFKHLLIATPLANSQEKESYMPSLLGFLSIDELEVLRSRKTTPLLIQFKNGWPRCGVFCCLQVYLIKECKWSLGRISSRNMPKQNFANLYLPETPYLVSLIDSITYIEVYIESCMVGNDVTPQICQLVRESVCTGIESACETLHYKDEQPELAFFCPHENNPADSDVEIESPPISKRKRMSVSRHPAVVLQGHGMRCIQCDSSCYPLKSSHKIWLPRPPEARPFDRSVSYGDIQSKEYKAMVRCCDSLTQAMSQNPLSLAISLFKVSLISEEVSQETAQLNETKKSKGLRLYHAVLDVVKSSPKRLSDLLDILKKDQTLYENVLEELAQE